MDKLVIVDEAVNIPGADFYIVEGCCWWEEGDIIPLTDSLFNVVGKAQNLERDGRFIRAEVDVPFPKTYECAFYLTGIEWHFFKNHRFVTKGRLTEVNIRPLPDEARLDAKEA